MASRVRNSRRLRGYGSPHMRRRRQLAPLVASGVVACAECGHLIEAGEKWHLGHTDDRTGYVGPEHVRCNTRKAGYKSHGLEPAEQRESRRW